MEKEKAITMDITEQEWQVLQLIRELEYGELLITVKGGKPVRAEEIRRSIQIR